MVSGGKRWSTLSDIKPWAAEECSHSGVLFPVISSGSPSRSCVYRWATAYLPGLRRGSWEHGEGRGSCDSGTEVVSAWPDFQSGHWFQMRLRVRNHTGPRGFNSLFFLDWMCYRSPTLLLSPALECSAHTADEPPWVSPVCISAVTMAHCWLSCLTAQLWLHPLAELPQQWTTVQLTSLLKGTWSI